MANTEEPSNVQRLERRPLGRTGYEVMPIGLGAWAMGGDMWGEQSDADSIAALNRAIDLGVNLLDTAIAYGMGHSEQLVGRVVRERGLQGKIVVTSKIPPMSMEWNVVPGTPIRDVFPAQYLRDCVDTSLRNLGLDRVDVMQLHTWSREWNNETEWFEVMSDLKAQGKIGGIGISVFDHDPDQANDTIAASRVDVIQVIYNMLDWRPEVNLFPLAEKHNVGILARVPLASGALTGKWDHTTTFEPGDWRGSVYAGDRLRSIVDRVKKLSFLTEDGSSLSEAALRFVISHRAVSACIPGARNSRQVEQNAAAIRKGALPAADLARLHALWQEELSRDPQTSIQV